MKDALKDVVENAAAVAPAAGDMVYEIVLNAIDAVEDADRDVSYISVDTGFAKINIQLFDE